MVLIINGCWLPDDTTFIIVNIDEALLRL